MKILALHGYTQSGAGFQRKVKRIETRLRETYPDASFHFITGPIRLKTSEMVSVAISQEKPDPDFEENNSEKKADTDDIDCHAWFRLHDHQDPPTGFLRSLEMLADCLRNHGPFDGVLGFSQGALMAIMIASLLEGKERREAFARAEKEYSETLPFPASFKDIQHPPFKFGITYGALLRMTKKYAPFYHDPHIQTPFCQFSGLWDPVVNVETTAAVNRLDIGGKRSLKVLHPGAHAVCTEGRYLDTVVEFIKDVERYHAEPILDYGNLWIEDPVTQSMGDDSSTRGSSSSSTISLSSNTSRSSSVSANRRKDRNVMTVRRKALCNPLVTRSSRNLYDRGRSNDSRSDVTMTDMSSTNEEMHRIKADRQQVWLNEALEIFLNECIQVEALHGSPPSRSAAQEMAVRILRTSIV